MEKKRSGQSGFTLVELLVVIVILGVLAGVVVFAVGGINDKGKDSACKTDKSSVETAEEAYFALKDTYVNMTPIDPGPLVPHFLHEGSTLHRVTDASATDYNVVGIESCVGK